MSSVQAQLKKVIQVPNELVAELVTTTVSRLGWRIKFVNQKLKQLSAFENKTEKRGQDVWHFEFDTVIKWRKVDNGIEVSVTVVEKQMEWTQEQCAKRCEEIITGIIHDAKELNESDNVDVDTFGSAKWATEEDLNKAGYRADNKDQRRFILGPAQTKDFISVPAQETAMHIAVCGPTGSGKSSTIFIPNLIERTGISAIVTEATAGDEPPDLFHKTAGFRKLSGHKIYKFNPDDLTSHRINPLQYVKTFDQAGQIANLIIQNTSARYSVGDQIWENSERQLLTVLIMHAISEGEHLGTVRKWLRKGPEGLGMILMNSKISEVQAEYGGFYKSSSEGFRNGVVSGLMQRLNLWVNPRIVALTQETDIDLKELPNELFTFYLAVPAQKTHLKPLAALIFNFILNLALEQRFKHPLALLLDEFTNYGYVPGVAEKLTIIRHRDIPATLGFQDYVQLRKVYGDEDASLLFGQPGTKVFFRPRDINTARKISDGLGSKTIVDRKVTTTGHIQERELGRPLMNPGEVMALSKGNAIVFTPSTQPLLLKTFEWQKYKEPMAYPPPEFRKIEVDEELVLSCNEAKSKPEWQMQKTQPAKEPAKTRNRSDQGKYKPKKKDRAEQNIQYDDLDELEKTPEY